MPETKDYYAVLGVPEDADAQQIKKAYRKLARKHHPDRNPDDPQAEETFKEVQEAHEVLSDPQKRKKYDALRRGGFSGFGNGGFNTRDGGGGTYYRAPDGRYVHFEPGTPEEGLGFDDLFGGRTGSGSAGGFSDFFNRFFGGQAQGPPGGVRQQQAADLHVETTLRISVEQALKGGRTQVKLPGGEAVRLKIPRGARPGMKIRLRGRGRAGLGGRRGDLYVTFDVAPHPRFRRRGDDLYLTTSINAFEAMLGATRSITTAYGRRLKITVPPGTQPGERLRLKGLGVETRDGRGDLFVEIEVTIPNNLTPPQQTALRKAAEEANLL